MGRTKKPSVLIVGAGVGGVATAARLAKAGLDVTVVEKNGFTGGRCSLIEKDGYVRSNSPSVEILYLRSCSVSTKVQVCYSFRICSIRRLKSWERL
jgi:heterodisulfide reductase subunit A-like polyferredoxin